MPGPEATAEDGSGPGDPSLPLWFAVSFSPMGCAEVGALLGCIKGTVRMAACWWPRPGFFKYHRAPLEL